MNVACEEIVTTFVERMDEGIGEFASRPIEGYVVQVSGNTIYLNLGRDSGIKVGDLVRIFHPVSYTHLDVYKRQEKKND